MEELTTQMGGLKQRARDFMLASVVTSYPDSDFEELVSDLTVPLAAHPGVGGLFAALLAPGGVDEVRSAYIDLFDRGQGRSSLYETEYGRMRGMSKGTDLADIAGFYHAFGLTLDSDAVHEMLDHIAVELEFYSVLLLKQAALVELADSEGVEVVEDARKKFLLDHLGRLARAVSEREDVRDHPIYGTVFTWCWQLVGRECELLGAVPAPLDFFADEELRRDMACGSVHLPVVD